MQDRVDRAVELHDRAVELQDVQQFAQAHALCAEALQLMEEADPGSPDVANMLNTFAALQESLGNYAGAAESSLRGIAIMDKIGIWWKATTAR